MYWYYMANPIKRKNISKEQIRDLISEWWYYDSNWEWHELEVEENQINKFIFFKRKHHMKLWDSYITKLVVYDTLWDYAKYVYFLSDFINYRGQIDFKEFARIYSVGDSLLSRIKKRLKDWAIIKQIEWVWYMNPAIISKGDRVETEIFEAFRIDNSKLYWITEL